MFSITESTEVILRRDLAKLCNRLGLRCAVEVGTDQGSFAAEFLEGFEGYQLYCVDPYLPYPEMNRDRTPDLMFAVQQLAKFLPRVRILKLDSQGAIEQLAEMKVPVEFVYIDASHELWEVRRDIAFWWGILRPGGVLAGHDFDPGHPGVMAAVKSFAELHDLPVMVTTDADTAPSWFVLKPAEKTAEGE
jgi:Methyltransferase domain